MKKQKNILRVMDREEYEAFKSSDTSSSENTDCTCGHHLNKPKKLGKSSEQAMVRFAVLLRGIHSRLLVEGWKIKGDTFIKPDGTKLYAPSSKKRNTRNSEIS